MRGISAAFGAGIFTSRSAGECARRARRAVLALSTRECTRRVQRAASVSKKPLLGARRLTYFLAALSALHHLDIPCPCNAREHPLGRGGRRKSDKNRQFPLLPLVGGVVPPFGATPQTSCLRPLPVGFSLALLFPSTLSPLSIFLVAALELPCGCFSAVVVVGYAL